MNQARTYGAMAVSAALLGALVGGSGADAGAPCSLPASQCQLPDQLGHGSGGTLAATSDPGAGDNGFFAAENFSPVMNDTVTSLCWWGIYFDFADQVDCSPGGGIVMTVTYFEMGAGVPGPLLAGPFTVSPNIMNTGLQINGVDEFEFTASHPPVAVTGGECYWVQITGNPGSTDCNWLWSTAPPGDGRAAQDAEGDGYDNLDTTDYDLAVCLDIDTDVAACVAPANDTCAQATNVGDGVHPFTNRNATTSGQTETLCDVDGDNQVGSDVWFRYVSDCSDDVTLDLCASTFDTRVAVYESFCPFAANGAIACNDDACGSQSQLTFAATGGTVYFIRVGGFEGAQGDGVLSISSPCVPPPGNNGCSSGLPLFPGATAVTTVGATTSGFAESCVLTAGDTPILNETWYRLIDECDENVNVTVTDATFNPVIVVYGQSCPTGSGTAIACGQEVNFDGSGASFFRMALGSADGSTGTATVTVTCGPPVKTCPGDTNGDLDVDVNDLNNVILDWGTDGSANGGDITGPTPGSPPDGIVNVNDLNAIIVNWGECT